MTNPKQDVPIAEDFWMIHYDDAEVANEYFAGEGAELAAMRRYTQAKMSWNCQLLSTKSARAEAEVQRLREELAQVLRQYEAAQDGFNIAMTERDALRKQVEALEKPVSDEEWAKGYRVFGGIHSLTRNEVDRIISARKQAAK